MFRSNLLLHEPYLDVSDTLDLAQKPTVDLRDIIDFVYISYAPAKCFRDCENAFIIDFCQRFSELLIAPIVHLRQVQTLCANF